MPLPRVRFTVRRLMVAVAIVAVTLAVEIAIVGITWHVHSAIYYIDKPPLPLMIAVAAVPAVLAMLYPSPSDPPEPEG